MYANGISHMPARWVTLALAGALALLLVAMSGTAVAKDRNHDQIPDRWEKRHDLSLKVNQANRDQDTDDMPNLGEFEGGTDPRDEDTDGDGVPDAEEMAGEVASFTPGTEENTGTLVINLYSGEVLSGEVTEDTTIAVLSDEDEEALETAARPDGPPLAPVRMRAQSPPSRPVPPVPVRKPVPMRRPVQVPARAATSGSATAPARPRAASTTSSPVQ